jgi:hypothetical protein
MKKMPPMDNMKMPMTDSMPSMKDMPSMGEKPSIVNTPDQHAFVMAGVETLFLCHLTMLHMENHMYELVLQASLPLYAQMEYLKDLARNPTATYFLGNAEQDLMTIPEIHIGSRVAFTANIWRGIPEKHHYRVWPWKHQDPIVSNVTVKIDRVVRIRHFNFAQQYPESMTYFLFGSGTEAHLYHYQTHEPDFDQVVSLAEAPSFIPPPQLQSGVLINIPDIPADKIPCSNPLTKKEYLVQYEGIDYMRLHEIKIERSLWFSTKITNAKNPCPGQ